MCMRGDEPGEMSTEEETVWRLDEDPRLLCGCVCGKSARLPKPQIKQYFLFNLSLN